MHNILFISKPKALIFMSWHIENIRQEILRQLRDTACSSGDKSLTILVFFYYFHLYTSSVEGWTDLLILAPWQLNRIPF